MVCGDLASVPYSFHARKMAAARSAVLLVLLVLTLAVSTSAKVVSYVLNLTSSYEAPDGVYREVFLVNGTSPGPMITCDEGDWLNVLVYNNLDVDITVHWHGIHQLNTPWLDGASGITQYPISPGSTFRYNFTTEGQYGNFWYHAHMRARYQDGVYGGIYIRPSELHPKPYELITKDPKDLKEILALDKEPTLLAVADWYKWTSDAILTREFKYGIDPPCIQSYLINGKGRVVCQDAKAISDVGAWRVAGVFAASGGVTVGFDTQGCVNMTVINGFPGVDQKALEAPGNSLQCTPTYTDREVIYVNGSRWKLFDVSNMGGEMGVHFSIDSHPFYVVMMEGIYIEPQLVHQLYVGAGQRFLVLVKTDKEDGIYGLRFASPELAQVIESVAFLSYPDNVGQPDSPSANVTVYQNIGADLIGNYTAFNSSIAYPLDKSIKPPTGAADKTIRLYSNRTGAVSFSLAEDGSMMSMDMELGTPVLFADPLPKDGVVLDLGIKKGDVVDIIINNSNLIAHPLHLHGHNFYVVSSSDSANFGYNDVAAAIKAKAPTLNFVNPVYRDGFTVGVGGHGVLRFIADNPGAWMFHCHLNTHLMGGMGVVIIEDREKAIKKIPKEYLRRH